MRPSSAVSNSGFVLPSRQPDQFEERRPAGGDEITDLVEQVAVVVPTQDQRVQVDDRVPQILWRLLDAGPKRFERVIERPVAVRPERRRPCRRWCPAAG